MASDTVVYRFAARLLHLRTERGLTQANLALRAKLNTNFISQLERRSRIPSLTTLEQLARGLDVELSVLVDFPESRTKRSDRVHDEIALLEKRLEKQDVETVTRIRKAVDVLLG